MVLARPRCVILLAFCAAHDAYLLSPPSVRRAPPPTLLAKPSDDVQSSRAALNAALMRDATRLKGFGSPEQLEPEQEAGGWRQQLLAVIYVAACATIGWNWSLWLDRLLGQWRFLVGVAVGVAAVQLRARLAKKGR